MGPFNIRLTREELDALEDIRRTLGARSKAEVVRHWIKLASTPETLGHHGPKARDR